MDAQPAPRRDPVTRAAVRQLLVLGAVCVAVFAGLMAALAWASSITGGGSAVHRAIDFETRTITLVLEDEPPQLDSTRSTDAISFRILGHVMEGLIRYDASNDLVPGVAERWEIRPEGATFWLREDARWSDGRPVTAHDFVFAWRKVVDPANASEYAFILYPVRHAEAINTRTLPVEQLGVRAVSPRVLEVEFEGPVAFFDKLVAFGLYFPVREDFYESRGERYGADAVDLLYNGPFAMTRWVHGAHVRLEKNPHYWNRDTVQLNTIDMPYVTSDTTAAVNLFKDGSIASTGLGQEQLEEAMKLRWNLGRYVDGSVFYVDFNFRPERPTSNVHLRRALQLVNDSAELVNKVIALPGYQPGVSMFPGWLTGVEGPFRHEYPPPVVTPDHDKAREHLAIARQELGDIRPLVLLTDDSPIANKQAEYYQNLFQRTLGIEIRLDKQIFKQRLEKMTSGDFDMVAAGWGPDYADPLTYGDLYASWNGNNRGLYENPELDAQVRIAQSSLDPRTRMDAFGEIQRILIEDAVHLPAFERGRLFVQRPELRGVVRRTVGTDPDYTHAWLEETP
ncbi:MAG: peptide ABC transporter substrate-binding protein [Acidimicrobiia bacterium]|nr:peptide ABC transporter substrate-binding protein [Acidimicrobiia bacterium]